MLSLGGTRSLLVLCFSLCLAMGSPSAATGPQPLAMSQPRATLFARSHRFAAHARPKTAVACSGRGAGSFIGAHNNNVAAGTDAAVVDGYTNEACDPESAIVAGDANTISGGAESSILAGYNNYVSAVASSITGGDYNDISGVNSAIAAGDDNVVEATGSAIAGGNNNWLAADWAFIGSGIGNAIVPAVNGGGSDSSGSVIDGGYGNEISAVVPNGSQFSSIGGGSANSLEGLESSIGGGAGNVLDASYSFIGGGYQNAVHNGAQYSTIDGGENNTVSGTSAVVGGGFGNVASGQNATVPGGAANIAAGAGSFAAGLHSNAKHDGSFVFSDAVSNAAVLSTSAANQFLVRASGGRLILFEPDAKVRRRLARRLGLLGVVERSQHENQRRRARSRGDPGKSYRAPNYRVELSHGGTRHSARWADGTRLLRGLRCRRRRSPHHDDR
jgi:hypothetical protein